MKKNIVLQISVLFLVLTSTSAQTYTQAFDSVFANENGGKTDITDLPNYKHSVGLNVGMHSGFTMKFNLKNNWCFQADMGVSLLVNPFSYNIGVLGPWFYVDFGGHLNLLYERKFTKRTHTFWFVGIGGGFGKELIGAQKPMDSPYMKTDTYGILGIEWFFDIPLSLQLETQLGYGLIFAPKNANFDNVSPFFEWPNPYHFMEIAFVFSVKYCFGKRNQ